MKVDILHGDVEVATIEESVNSFEIFQLDVLKNQQAAGLEETAADLEVDFRA